MNQRELSDALAEGIVMVVASFLFSWAFGITVWRGFAVAIAVRGLCGAAVHSFQ